jgi:hypothetical protein
MRLPLVRVASMNHDNDCIEPALEKVLIGLELE